ncbi:ThuA domain-containing protein [Streptomyces venezuelae]|uniref:ThuA domain-containing protein n=1 Tax=Streptomyces venezuelae TaxID=54571 RepID=UPI00278BDAA4|nr:ThuA domain-containing protein [Streptomyces venezuelae]
MRPLLTRLLALMTLVLGLGAVGPAQAAPTAPEFRVLAFYNGTWDAAHIDFVKEANDWFPRAAAANNFSYTATTDWNLLADGGVDAYDVVLFLDDAPQSPAQRAGFERYMRNGGGWLGFHVSAFTTQASGWDWYYNRFLGSGDFRSNTWGPTTALVRTENASHPAAAGLPATWTTAVSEWYSWTNNLRSNPDIKVLASVDPAGFPLGTDPNQTWYSGDYPLVWTNTRYRMLYANFGHNAMNYSTNTRLSSTFAGPTQNRLVLDSLRWLAGAGPTPPPGPFPGDSWYTLAAGSHGLCVDVRAAGTANGTAVQQYTCNGTQAQQFRFTPTTDGYTRVGVRLAPQQTLDVTDRSTADGAPLQLWSYAGGTNQQWLPVAEASGRHHFVARHSGKCLSAAGAATAGAALVQRPCDGSPSQSFLPTAVP